jgi:hypothetical protein
MSEQVYDATEGGDGLETPPPPRNGELVHWMAPKRLRIGPAGMSATAGAAFTLGVVTAVAALALAHWLGPERTVIVRREA